MKKLFYVLLIALIAALACCYIFIPAELQVTTIVHVRSSPAAAIRLIRDSTKRASWFPTSSPTTGSTGPDGLGFGQIRPMGNAFRVGLFSKADTLDSHLLLIQQGEDSAAIEWNCLFPAGSNPLARATAFSRAGALKQRMTGILARLDEALDNTENVYGIKIEPSRVKDTLLVAIKKQIPAAEAAQQLYPLIGRLKAYATAHDAVPTGDPMTHLTKRDGGMAEIMVALPVNRPLPSEGDFLFRRMVPGNLLTALVKGGPDRIRAAEEQMAQYFFDNNKVAMAIPFQSLLTDRSREQDTSAWLTRICSPVMR